MKPLLESYDLIIAGGGFAGFAAAVQSSRLGMTTLLIEKSAHWGGTAYEGMHQALCGLYPSGETVPQSILNPGISNEISDSLIMRGQGKTSRVGKLTVLEYEPQAMQQIMIEIAGKEKRLEVLFEACVDKVEVESKVIKQICVSYQNKTIDIPCRAVMDCSGSGEVIRLSGASYEIASAGERQLAAYAVEIEGVENDSDMLNLKTAYGLSQAAEQGRLAAPLRFSVWMPGRQKGRGTLRMSVLPQDSKYKMESIRKQADQIHEVLKNSLPEFKNSRILRYAGSVVEREGLRMRGLYTLTREDVLSGKKFQDGAVKNAWPVEFWDQKKGPRYDYLHDGEYYEIPSACLQSKDIKNLFAAGRCLSADAEALASARVTGTCLALGEQGAKAVSNYLEAALNIVSVMKAETRKHSERQALRQAGKTISYGDLSLKTEQLARVLKSFPLKKYARVGILVREGIDYVLLNLAVLSLQAVIVPVPQSSSKDEIENMIVSMKLDALIFDKTLYMETKSSDGFSSSVDQHPFEIAFFQNDMKEQKEFESLNPAFIRFTSGTTGESKGVVISHEAIMARTDAADKALKITHEDRIIWVLSMSYHFIVTILLFLRRGAEIILCEHEIPKGLIEGLSDETATLMYAAPVHYQAMNQSDQISRAHVSRIRMAISTTTHLSDETAQRFFDKFGFELSMAYGIIELGLPFVNSSRLPGKRLSVGTLTPGFECRLRAQDKEGSGIIQIQGPGMWDAYFSPWKLRKEITQDGYFETGDIGRLDNDGFLFLLGRHQEVISFLGMKIFPREIEAVLQQNPGIEQAHVYGEEHAVYGRMPCAKLILKSGYPDFNEDELRKFCYARLPSYKVPKKFEVVESLKKTKSGKVKTGP